MNAMVNQKVQLNGPRPINERESQLTPPSFRAVVYERLR